MSKKVLIRLDDLGYTEGVTLGMLAVHQKQPKVSCGFMVNEDFSKEGVALASQAKDLCLGIHISLSSGTPASNPQDIPSLVDETGAFRESNYYRKFIWAGEEPFPNLAELKIEMKNQIEQFVAFFGKKPDYIDLHALKSDHFVQAINEVGKEAGIPTSPYYTNIEIAQQLPLDGNELDFANTEEMIAYLEKEVPLVDGVNMIVAHPAFLDAALFKKSSLNTARIHDYAMLTSPAFYQWLETQGAELITFNQLV